MKSVHRIIFLGSLWYVSALSLFSCTQQQNWSDTAVIKRVPPDTVAVLLQKKDSLGILLLDVRTPEEYQEGHLPGAILIPVQVLETQIEQIAEYKDRPVIVYCRSGNRSRTASRILADHGFTLIYDMDGGIRKWRGPIEK